MTYFNINANLAIRALLVSLLILLLAVSAWADSEGLIPVDFKKWQDSEDTLKFVKRIGGEIANYQKSDSAWEKIENDFKLSGDTLVYNRKDIIKTAVRPNGLSIAKVTWGGVDYIVTQKMIKLIWLNVTTWNWIDVIDSVVWSTPSIDSNIIHWSNIFPQVDYRIRKSNCSVAHGIFFKPLFLDSAVTLYNQRSDSLDIALGNVIEYNLINVDNADSAMGNLNFRVLKHFGSHVFELSKQRVHFPGSDTMPELPVKQRWIKRGGKLYCVEYVMMRRIKQIHEVYPNAVIWHNDETKVIDGTTNVEDACIISTANLINYGSAVYLGVRGTYRSLIRVKNVATELGVGATITGCVDSMYCYFQTVDGDIGAYRVLKPWEEGNLNNVDPEEGEGCTWDDWYADSKEWAIAGCDSANDQGVDNSGDGDEPDRKATAEDTENVTTVNTWYAWSISTTLAQGWYDGTINEEGIILIWDGASKNNFYSTENDSNQPFWTFTYTTGEPPEVAPTRRRRPVTGASFVDLEIQRLNANLFLILLLSIGLSLILTEKRK